MRVPNYHNAVFIGKDESGTPKYAALRSTLGSTFKQDASGSDKRYSFRLLAREPMDTVHLFEAAIDLMSYATYLKCEGKDYKSENLLSLSGVYQPKKEMKDSKIPIALTTFLSANPKIKTIVLHLDNDKAGRLCNVARQAVDEAISKSFTLKDFDRQLAEMGYRINFDPNRKYWTIIGRGWQRPKRLYKLGEEYTNDRIMERISENSYAVKFQSFSEPQPQVKVWVKVSLKNAKKIGGLRGLYLHYCYKLGILPKGRKQNYARLHYLLKDDLMKMKAITQETRLLCRNHIDTAEQLCSYKGSLETEMSALLQKRKELYSKSRRISGEEKEAVKVELSDISGRLKIIRKEVRLCEGIAARSDTLKEKLQTIRADENEQRRKELMKNEHRRRSGRTNRPNELQRQRQTF